jgi:3-dehydrosphinganine reductase
VPPRLPLTRDTHAIITGGSRGIGFATARALSERGVRVSLIARDPDVLGQAAGRLGASGAPVATAAADVADAAAVTAAIDELTATHGSCDLLVTSAGATRPGRFLDLDDDVFRHLMEVNYYGTIHPIRAVAPAMVARGSGAIVGVSSAAGLLGVFGYTAYAASKFAVRGLLESLRQELRPHGVLVATAYPADVDTDMLAEEDAWKPDETRAIAGTIRPIPPERVATAILRAVERGRSHITTDVGTAALDRVFGLARRPIHHLIDRKVARSRR